MGTLRVLKANSSDANPPDPSLHEPAFNRGDEVTVRSRFTWRVSVPGRDNFRKDINEGQQGVIEGWADRHQKQVLLKLSLELPGVGQQTVVQEAWPRNLTHTSEYLAAKANAHGKEIAEEEAETEDAPSTSDPTVKPVVPDWALAGDKPENVRLEPSLKSLVADDEKTMKKFFVHSCVGGAH